MSFEIGLAIILGLFPFGWEMLEMPHLKIVGCISWVTCLGIVIHLTAKSNWFKNLLEKHPKSISAVLGSIGTLILCGAIGLYFYTRHSSVHWKMTPDQEEVVYGQRYTNQEVEIDGKKFDHCVFDNATLVYHGTAPTDIQNISFSGKIYLKSDNDGIKTFMELSNYLSHFKGAVTFMNGTMDEHGNFTPLP